MPLLPGLELLDRLGRGEVWRARDRGTGGLVVVRRVAAGALDDGLAREAVVLSELAVPYLVRVQAVLPDDGADWLVFDHAAGGSLAALLRRRGRLDPGEVVTVGVPLAEALAAAHARGLVHGALAPRAVLFTRAGMPLLDGFGQPRSVSGGPADDVRALAALCAALLPDPAEPAAVRVAEVLDAAAAAGSEAPGAAAALARALRAAHPAAPVHLRGGAGRPSAPDGALGGPPEPATRGAAAPFGRAARGAGPSRHAAPPDPRLSRRLPVVLGGAALLAGAAAGGWLLGGGAAGEAARLAAPAAARAGAAPGPASRAPGPAPAGAAAGASPTSAAADPAASPDWRAVLDGLDAVRAAAFAAGDPARLSAVYADGSPALAADGRVLRELAAQGRTAHGVRHDLRAVRVLAFDGRTARLRLRDALRAHRVLGPGAAVVAERPAGAERDLEAVVVRTAAGWRLRALRAG